MKLYVIFLLISVGIKCLSTFILQNFLGYINLFFVSGVIIWTLYQQFLTKNCLTLKKGLLILCMFAIITVPNQAMAIGKFYLLEPLYQHAAEQIAEEIIDGSDTILQKIQLSVPERILLNNCEKNAECQKYNNYYTISFTKHRNFFQYYAYVYFSEPEAITLITNPSRYWVGYDDASAYDTIIWIEQDKWALVKYY